MTKKSTNSTNGNATRLYFIDHLRVFLTILVVLHHVAMVYGGIQPFYYLEPPTSLPAFLGPLIFVLLNQAWFMGAFFLLAGCTQPTLKPGVLPDARQPDWEHRSADLANLLGGLSGFDWLGATVVRGHAADL